MNQKILVCALLLQCSLVSAMNHDKEELKRLANYAHGKQKKERQETKSLIEQSNAMISDAQEHFNTTKQTEPLIDKKQVGVAAVLFGITIGYIAYHKNKTNKDEVKK